MLAAELLAKLLVLGVGRYLLRTAQLLVTGRGR